jgi:hypothetical protein
VGYLEITETIDEFFGLRRVNMHTADIFYLEKLNPATESGSPKNRVQMRIVSSNPYKAECFEKEKYSRILEVLGQHTFFAVIIIVHHLVYLCLGLSF